MLKKLLALMLAFMSLNIISYAETVTKKTNVGQIVGKDTFSREVKAVSGFKEDKYVGLFYFTWHGFTGSSKIYDITKIMRDNPDDLWDPSRTNPIAPSFQTYYFNEPLYGYYNSADPYIIRKHLEMFIAADIDFLAFDFTNAVSYNSVLITLLEIYEEYRLAGHKVPKLTFFTNTQSGKIVDTVYKLMYKDDKYKELWFYGPYDKPLMIAWEDQVVNQEQKDFFHFRPPQWPEAAFVEEGFPYVEKVRPQRLYGDLMVVSVTQHVGGAFSWSYKGPHGSVRESWGRGYTSDHPENWDSERNERGLNFQEQWDYAISVDPQMIFVTGWNEWVAGKFVNDDYDNYGPEPYWVDTFNTEFSRDIEMTKASKYLYDEEGIYLEEGYGDNFYLQLIENVRRFKGIYNKGSYSVGIGQEVEYANLSIENYGRDFMGAVDRLRYRQDQADNFIDKIIVKHDKDNIYFTAITDKDISKREKDTWMNLFIGVESRKEASFESYHFLVNREVYSEDKTSLEVSRGGYNFDKLAEIDYKLDGNRIEFTIPRKILGVKKNDDIYFKFADSIEKPDDIMDYYVSGSSVPIGRLSYLYSIKDSGFKKLKLNPLEILVLGLSGLMVLASAFVFVLFKKRK